MDTLKSIFERRSIRKYKRDVAVSDEQIENILKAGFSAPSAHGGSPWEFIVIDDRDIIEKLSNAKIYYKKPLTDAPLAIAILIDKDKNSENIKLEYKFQDCSAAMENMLIAATAQGLGTCWMGGLLNENDMATVIDILKIPQNRLFFGVVSVGEPDEKKEAHGVIEKSKVHYNQYNG
jgi:nitroreductase